MKKVALMVLVAIFTMSFSVMAQQKTGKQGQRAQAEMRWNAKERAANMAKQLDLTDEQKAKVEALFEKQDAKHKELMAKYQGKREEMAKVRDQVIAENNAELESIIGKEKMEQMKKMRDENQQKMRNANRRARQHMNAPRNK
jgi:Spy/CpxP family protein refolding chaperone